MMVIGRLRPSKKTKYSTKSGRPRAPPRDEMRAGLHAQREQTSASHLERLPTELIQDIFLFSANLHLPLCSKQLLASLTSDHLKYEITLQILVFQKDKLHAEDKSLLLTRRFFVWDFMVRYVSFAQSRVPMEVVDGGEKDVTESEDEGYAGTCRSANTASSHSETIGGPSSHYAVDVRLTSLVKDGLLEVWQDEGGTLLEMENEPEAALDALHEKKSLQGLRDLSLPGKLLHGDLNDDTLRMLRLLIAFNCRVEPNPSALAEAKSGIFEAIEQEDEEVVAHLLGVHVGVKPDIDMLREAMKGSNLSIIYQVLRNSHEELDRLDPQVWKLLDGHLGWNEQEKVKVRKWLRNGARMEMVEEDEDYMPHPRDIEVNEGRWDDGLE